MGALEKPQIIIQSKHPPREVCVYLPRLLTLDHYSWDARAPPLHQRPSRGLLLTIFQTSTSQVLQDKFCSSCMVQHSSEASLAEAPSEMPNQCSYERPCTGMIPVAYYPRTQKTHYKLKLSLDSATYTLFRLNFPRPSPGTYMAQPF